jgi:hypothetical protein
MLGLLGGGVIRQMSQDRDQAQRRIPRCDPLGMFLRHPARRERRD